MNPCSNEPPDSKKCDKIKPLPTPPPKKKNTNKQNKNKNKQNTQVVAIEVSSPDRHSHRIWSPAIQIRLKGEGGGKGERREMVKKSYSDYFISNLGFAPRPRPWQVTTRILLDLTLRMFPAYRGWQTDRSKMSSLSVVHNNHSRSFTYSFPMAT